MANVETKINEIRKGLKGFDGSIQTLSNRLGIHRQTVWRHFNNVGDTGKTRLKVIEEAGKLLEELKEEKEKSLARIMSLGNHS